MQSGRLVDPFGRGFTYDAMAHLRELDRREKRAAKQVEARGVANVSAPKPETFLRPS